MNILFTSAPCPEARAWLNEQPDIQTAWNRLNGYGGMSSARLEKER